MNVSVYVLDFLVVSTCDLLSQSMKRFNQNMNTVSNLLSSKSTEELWTFKCNLASPLTVILCLKLISYSCLHVNVLQVCCLLSY